MHLKRSLVQWKIGQQLKRKHMLLSGPSICLSKKGDHIYRSQSAEVAEEYKTSEWKLASWILKLEEYDYIIEHRPGSMMQHADALSRAPVNSIQVSTLSWKEFEEIQNLDEDILVPGWRYLVSLWRTANARNVNILSVLALHRPFYISICTITLPTQDTTFTMSEGMGIKLFPWPDQKPKDASEILKALYNFFESLVIENESGATKQVKKDQKLFFPNLHQLRFWKKPIDKLVILE